MVYNFYNNQIPRHSNGWRENLIRHFQTSTIDGDIYQFGVASGYSMQVIGSIVQITNSPRNVPNFFGFDVFEGIPVENVEPEKQLDIPGSFKLTELFDTNNMADALTQLEKDVKANLPINSHLSIIKGLVEDTLSDDFLKCYLPRQAFYIDMDMDIYSPTKFALSFLIRNKIIVPGTLIGFDDWGQNYPEYPTFTCGESRALKEICEEFGVQYDTLAIVGQNEQAVIKITAIG